MSISQPGSSGAFVVIPLIDESDPDNVAGVLRNAARWSTTSLPDRSRSRHMFLTTQNSSHNSLSPHEPLKVSRSPNLSSISSSRR